MNSKYKSIISLGLVSLLTACGSESSLSLSEGLIQGNNIRAQQMSTEFVAPSAFSIERTVEEVTPTKTTQIKQIWQNVIVDVDHHYAYQKVTAFNKVSGTDSKTFSEQWTYVKEDFLYVVMDDGKGNKNYTETAFDAETDATFIDIRDSFHNLYLGNEPLDYLLVSVATAGMTNPFLNDDFYNQTGDSFDTQKISIKSAGEGSLKVDLKLNQMHVGKEFTFVLHTTFTNYLLANYFYYEIQETQYIKNQITISNNFERHHPDLDDFTKIN